MRRFIISIMTPVFLLALTSFSSAQDTPPPAPPVVHGPSFVDLNGDGFNDNAPNHDGDGIPNGLDPDYTGSKFRGGKGIWGFVDLNGDGINDNMRIGMRGNGRLGRGGYGNGTGLAPRDGTGSGPGATSGNCDLTGPKGFRGGKSGKGN